MDDKEMIEELERGARIKLMTAETLQDIKQVDLLPERVRESMLAGEHGAELSLSVGEESRLEAGYLALAAKQIETGKELDAANIEGLCVRLREMADKQADYAERTVWDIEDVVNDDEMDEDAKEEEKFVLESTIESAREDTDFYRAVADRLTAKEVKA